MRLISNSGVLIAQEDLEGGVLRMRLKPTQETPNFLKVFLPIYFEHRLLCGLMAAFFENSVFAGPDVLGAFFAETVPYVEKTCSRACRAVSQLLIKNENN
jgi:hypothetical protein